MFFMRLLRLRAFVAIAGLCLIAAAAGVRGRPAQDPSDAFPGRWDLTLKAPNREYPSWLEIRREDGVWKARMVGRWGNARPLPKVDIEHNRITFVSPRQEENRPDDMIFEGELAGNMLSGTTTGPKGEPWTWTGRRAPALKRTAPPQWGQSISLFNGKDLAGWKFADPKSSRVWRVENGVLVKTGRGTDIITIPEFEDFKLHIEFNCGPDSNSGVYLRGRYEVQIETDSAREPPSHHTGAVYGFIAPNPELPRKPGEWQSFDITLAGRKITVVQDGRTVIDNQEIPGITGGALDSHEELPGPIYLQGGEDGKVSFRNIVIAPASGSGWQQVWSDEFNRPDGSAPDAGKWTMETGNHGGWGNKELEYYTGRTDNARIENGILVITANKESHAGFNYTSARMKTQGKFSWKYGRFEARIKLPRGQGIWPAFWMLGDDITTASWPKCGELDIMENIGKEPSTVHGTIHGPGYSGGKGIGAPHSLPAGQEFSNDYHVFAFEWEPEAIRWYVDGTLYQTRTPADLPAGAKWVFDHPFFIILNLAVGGNWPGSPDSTTVFPQRMLVDYVRVYQKR